MKKTFVTLALVAAAVMSAPAYALSPSQVRAGYYACLKFLALPAKQQAAVARNSGHTLKQDLWACRFQKKMGLAKVLKGNAEYNRCARGGCTTPAAGSNNNDVPRCISSQQCRGDENCLNDTCQEVNGSNHCGAGGLDCTSGETCVDGQCK